MNIDEAEEEMSSVIDHVKEKKELNHLVAGRKRLQSILSRSSVMDESLDYKTP